MKRAALYWIIGIVVVLLVGWYFISPAFKTVELQEESPISASINDNFETMNPNIKMEFDAAMKTSSGVVKEMSDAMLSGAKIISEASFKPRAHDVKGKAVLIEADGKKILRFEDFETINGPNLHIYLSSELGDKDYVDLGVIKATKGSANYELPADIDLEKYDKVLVWCVPFRVLFSYAEF